MDAPDSLVLPTAADDEKRATPLIRAAADLIGALAAAGGFIPPRRLERALTVADQIGEILHEPSLVRVLVLRALSAPPQIRAAIAALRAAAGDAAAPVRADIMRELARLMLDAGAEFGPDIAAALTVPLPESLKHPNGTGGGSVRDSVGTLVGRAMRLVRAEDPILSDARAFATDFAEPTMLTALKEAERQGDTAPILRALPAVLETVGREIAQLANAAAMQIDAEREAVALDAAAETMKRVAEQRNAAITRRGKMLKRHLQEDLEALIEDGVEEFEVDFRRLAENKGWFGRTNTDDLNDRVVVKNLERRYRNLARRYPDHLDLREREVAEYRDEFTRIGDAAIEPLARYQFRTVAPHPGLRLRLAQATDHASTATLAAGTTAAAASGVAMGTGILSTAAIAGAAVTPVGAAVGAGLLGAVALAGVWKMFAGTANRRRRDARDRARELEQKLRAEIADNYPAFCEAVDKIMARFQSAAVDDISRPMIEADRVREIALSRRVVAQSVADAAQSRVDRMLRHLRIETVRS